jgi:putative lipoic acid-binding regulatory protein
VSATGAGAPKGLEYPCEFPLKLFIRPDEEVVRRLMALAHSALPIGSAVNASRRMSSGGKYLALTLSFIAQDADHLDRVIKAVTADPGVLLAL